MSLLDGGPHEVTVWPEVETTDDDGNRVRAPSPTPFFVRTLVQPLGFTESAALGQDVTSTYYFNTRVFPGGAFARVSWAGRDWDVVGEPRRHARLGYVKIIIRARGPEVL